MKIKPFIIWRRLSDNNQKIGYWTIFTNVILVLVTFWLGIVVQDIVARRNADATGTLANAEYVKQVCPLIDSLDIKYWTITYDLGVIFEQNTNKHKLSDSVKNKAANYFYKNKDTLFSYFVDLCRTAKAIVPYINIDSVEKDSISAYAISIYVVKTILDVSENYKKQNMSYNDWVSSWGSVRKEIDKTLKSPEYIADCGRFYPSADILQAFKTLYNSCYSKNTADMYKAVLSYGFFEAMKIDKLIHEHATYKPKYSSNCVTNWITRNPIWSLIVVFIIGVLIAWVVSRTIPEEDDNISKLKKKIKEIENIAGKNRETIAELSSNFSLYKERYERTRSEYDKEHKYSSKLMSVMLENGIEVPPMDEV